MAGNPEPHRDQRTISSFKRTCNAALLLWVAGHVNQPRRPGRVIAAGGVAACVVLLATGHNPGPLLSGLP